MDLALGAGQSSQTACLAGTYNPNTGSTASTDCVDADVGHYVDQFGTGQSTQTACNAGTFNPFTGSTSSADCFDADAGHYVDRTLGEVNPLKLHVTLELSIHSQVLLAQHIVSMQMQVTMLIKSWAIHSNCMFSRNLQSKHWFYSSTDCVDADAGSLCSN